MCIYLYLHIYVNIHLGLDMPIYIYICTESVHVGLTSPSKVVCFVRGPLGIYSRAPLV